MFARVQSVRSDLLVLSKGTPLAKQREWLAKERGANSSIYVQSDSLRSSNLTISHPISVEFGGLESASACCR